MITTDVSNVFLRVGYIGFGSRGASEKYPSRVAASSSKVGSFRDIVVSYWTVALFNVYTYICSAPCSV